MKTKFVPRVFIAVPAALAVIGSLLVAISAGPASAASGPAFCTNFNGSVVCLNDWGNGSFGNSVKTFSSNSSNEDFVELSTGRCGGTVTTNCPFANSAYDNAYRNFPIVQLEYDPNGWCVATGTDRNAQLGNCNNSNGTGGSNGTLFVDHNGFMINVYWTNQGSGLANNAACMQGLSAGQNVYLSEPTGDGCEKWAVT